MTGTAVADYAGSTASKQSVSAAATISGAAAEAVCSDHLDLNWTPVKEAKVVPEELHRICQSCPIRLYHYRRKGCRCECREHNRLKRAAERAKGKGTTTC